MRFVTSLLMALMLATSVSANEWRPLAAGTSSAELARREWENTGAAMSPQGTGYVLVTFWKKQWVIEGEMRIATLRCMTIFDAFFITTGDTCSEPILKFE